jgi:urease accessory protein
MQSANLSQGPGPFMSVPAVSLHQPAPLQRARGEAEVGFRVRDGETRIDRLYQDGQAKIRLPRHHAPDPLTAVLINTAGGLTGGDLLKTGAIWGAGTRAVVTSQAAERIYRSAGSDAAIEARLQIGPGARAEWLPQETILFNRARFRRRMEVDLAGDASLLLVESLVLGRTAMGESVTEGFVSDHWRIRRDGRLVHAESFRLAGNAAAIMTGPACGAGALAFATVIALAPHVERRIDEARDLVSGLTSEAGANDAGVSAWDGRLVLRMIDRDAQRLRAGLVGFLENWRAQGLPRAWSC